MSKKKLFSFFKEAGVEALTSRPKLPPLQYKNNALKLHYPVMIENVKSLINEFLIDDTTKKCMIDCTLGLGGHSLSLLEKFENLFM